MKSKESFRSSKSGSAKFGSLKINHEHDKLAMKEPDESLGEEFKELDEKPLRQSRLEGVEPYNSDTKIGGRYPIFPNKEQNIFYLEENCRICKKSLSGTERRSLSLCHHEFHKNCIQRHLKVQVNSTVQQTKCPSCNMDISKRELEDIMKVQM